MSASQGRGGLVLRALACFLALLFVLSTPLIGLLALGELRMLQADAYKQALAEQDVYERLPSLIAEQIVYSGSISPKGEEDGAEPGESSSPREFISDILAAASPDLSGCLQSALASTTYYDLLGKSRDATTDESDLIKGCLRAYGIPASVADTKGGMPVFFWMLTEDEWLAILADLLPPEWLRSQTESLIDQAFEAIRSDEESAVVSVPLADLKTRIQGDAGYDALVNLLNAQPPCNETQLVEVAELAGSGQPLKDIPICRPPAEILFIVAPSIRATLAALADELPDEAELALIDEESPSSDEGIAGLRRIVGAADLVARIGLLVPLVLLALIAALAVRSARGFLLWWGAPLLLAGGLGMGLTAAGLVAGHALIGRLGEGTANVAPGFMDLVRDTAGSLAEGFLLTYGLAMFLVALTGLGMLVGLTVIRRRARTADGGGELTA